MPPRKPIFTKPEFQNAKRHHHIDSPGISQRSNLGRLARHYRHCDGTHFSSKSARSFGSKNRHSSLRRPPYSTARCFSRKYAGDPHHAMPKYLIRGRFFLHVKLGNWVLSSWKLPPFFRPSFPVHLFTLPGRRPHLTSTDRSSSYSMMWKYASHPFQFAGAGSFAIGSFRWL
jgi:hypothetical protein